MRIGIAAAVVLVAALAWIADPTSSLAQGESCSYFASGYFASGHFEAGYFEDSCGGSGGGESSFIRRVQSIAIAIGITI